MGRQYADVCDRCHRAVIKVGESDSSDMVAVRTLELLFLSDEYLPGASGRPALNLTDCRYCPDCLVEVIQAWVLKIETLKPSKLSEVGEVHG